jgi:hypothetical protein
LATFRPLGDFYLEAVFIITEVANIFRPLLCVHFDKNGLGYFMGDFYKLIRVARWYTYIQNKNPNFGKFRRALEWVMMVYSLVI